MTEPLSKPRNYIEGRLTVEEKRLSQLKRRRDLASNKRQPRPRNLWRMFIARFMGSVFNQTIEDRELNQQIAQSQKLCSLYQMILDSADQSNYLITRKALRDAIRILEGRSHDSASTAEASIHQSIATVLKQFVAEPRLLSSKNPNSTAA